MKLKKKLKGYFAHSHRLYDIYAVKLELELIFELLSEPVTQQTHNKIEWFKIGVNIVCRLVYLFGLYTLITNRLGFNTSFIQREHRATQWSSIN